MDTPTTGPAQPTPDEAANNTGAGTDGTQPTGAAAPPSAPTAPPLVQMTQEALDKLISRRLADDRKAREDEARKRAQEEAGNFKALYEQLQADSGQAATQAEARIAELTQTVADLSTAVNAQIDAAIKGWPKLATLTDPGPDNVPARQAWFAKVAPEVGTLQPQPVPPPGPHAPPPAHTNGAAQPSARQAQVSGTW